MAEPTSSVDIAKIAGALGGPHFTPAQGATQGMEGGQLPAPPPPASSPSSANSPEQTLTIAARAILGLFAAGFATQGLARLAVGEALVPMVYFGAVVITVVAQTKLTKWLPGFVTRLNRIASDVRWWVATILVMFVFFAVSPFVEQRRWPFDWVLRELRPASAEQIAGALAPLIRPVTAPQVGTPALSSKDIAAALAPVIKNEIDGLKQAIMTEPHSGVAPLPTAEVPPFVNPIHDDAIKWRVVRNVTFLMKRENLKCTATIRRYQVQYAEDYAADLKLVLEAAGWSYNEIFATSTLPRGLSLRAVQEGANQANIPCMNILAQRLQADVTLPNGVANNIETRSLPSSEAPDYLKECTKSCLEINIGNEAK